MVNPYALQFIAIGSWVKVTWEEFFILAEQLDYSVTETCSGQIQRSQILLGFAIPLVEEALLCSQTEDDRAITRWLPATFS